MSLRIAALAAALGAMSVGGANAQTPETIYNSISIQQMITILEAHGAKATETQQDGKLIVLADTPVGKLEVWFAECAEAPNPCGYTLVRRYKHLALSPKAMNMFNRRMAFGYAFRPDGSDDVLLAYPVALRDGASEQYIASTFAVPTGLEDVFEGFVTDTLHLKPEQLNQK